MRLGTILALVLIMNLLTGCVTLTPDHDPVVHTTDMVTPQAWPDATSPPTSVHN